MREICKNCRNVMTVQRMTELGYDADFPYCGLHEIEIDEHEDCADFEPTEKEG